MRRLLATLVLGFALVRPALAVDLDASARGSCADLDRQLAKNSETILALNTASERAVAAFDAGHPAEGYPDLLKVLGFADRVTKQLAVCQAEVRDGTRLLWGFQDTREHVTRAGHQMGCLGGGGS